MWCFCGGRRETPLSRFERKAAPVKRKLCEMKDQHTKMAHANNEQFKAARDEALKRYESGEPVLAFAGVLDALQHERQCKRLMGFVSQLDAALAKINSVWASHSFVEGFEEMSVQLHSLAADADSEAEDAGIRIDVSQNLHAEFDELMAQLQTQASKITVVDDTGTQMADADVVAQIEAWRSAAPTAADAIFPDPGSTPSETPLAPHALLMSEDDQPG